MSNEFDPTGAAAQRPMFDLTTEQSVLGAMMLAPDLIPEIEAIVSADSFYRPAHATIFTAITGQAAAGQPTDPVAIVAALAEIGRASCRERVEMRAKALSATENR